MTQLQAEKDEKLIELERKKDHKLMTTGKARAMVFVAKRALMNEKEALRLDKDDMKDAEKWDMEEDQELMFNGEKASVKKILEKMKSK